MQVYFRTWPRLDTIGVPGNGYELALGHGPDPRWSGRVLAHGRSAREDFDRQASNTIDAAAGEWHRAVLECRGDRAAVTIDDRVISVIVGIENPAGFIGWRGESGVVDVRNMLLTPLAPTESGRIVGHRAGSGGVELPRLLREVKPAYTADAMRERIQGAVLLEAIVREDGSVGTIEILRSLDPHFGLDKQAVAALRQWRFKAGSKDGQPVAVVVTVELSFTLKIGRPCRR